MPLLRKIFFYIFAFIYLIICPLIIFYALGYIFNPKKQKVIQTGLIYLSSTPENATVYLGKSRYTKKTPAALQELLPGNYSIRLILKKYKPWEHTVSVEPGKAVAFEKILLIPKTWQPQELSTETFKDLIPLSETDFFILTKGNRLEEYYIYNWREEKLHPLFSVDSAFRDARVISRFSVKKSLAFLIYADWKKSKKFLFIEIKDKKAKIEDISELFPEPPQHVEWDPDEPNILFTFQNGYLNKLDIAAKAVYPRYLEGIKGFCVDKKQIYIIDETALSRLNFDKGARTVLIDTALLGKSAFETKDAFFKIMPLKDKQLLFWQRNKIGIIDFSLEEPRLTWLYKEGKNIKECFWAYEGSHIIFSDREGVSLIELVPQGKPHLARITPVKSDASIFYSQDSVNLYYLNAPAGNLCAIKIIPE